MPQRYVTQSQIYCTISHIPSEEDGHSREFRLRVSRTLWESLQSVIIVHNNCRSDSVSVTIILRHQYIKFQEIHSPANQIKKMALIAMVTSSLRSLLGYPSQPEMGWPSAYLNHLHSLAITPRF